MTTTPTGVLIVGHGTRSPLGRAQFLWLAEQVQTLLIPLQLEPAFLELAEPTIDEAVGRLVQRGIEQLVTLPLLLFAAGHAKEDIPSAVKSALKKHGKSELPCSQAAHFGCHPALLELSRLRLQESLEAAASPIVEREPQTCHLLVGRGSHDETATAEMREFARLSQQATQLPTEIAFLAMARPRVSAQLVACASRGFERVIVQPHLLFHGDLIESLRHQVGEASREFGQVQWLTAETLADPPDTSSLATELLVAVIRERCLTTGWGY